MNPNTAQESNIGKAQMSVCSIEPQIPTLSSRE